MQTNDARLRRREFNHRYLLAGSPRKRRPERAALFWTRWSRPRSPIWSTKPEPGECCAPNGDRIEKIIVPNPANYTLNFAEDGTMVSFYRVAGSQIDYFRRE